MKLMLPATGIAIALSAACHSDRHRDSREPVSASAELPSRADLLANGGIYPVVVPMGWKLINTNGEVEALPAPLPGTTFNRIMAKGALLATEDPQSPDQSEAMMFTALHSASPITPEILDRYADTVVKGLTQKALDPRVEEKRMLKHGASGEPRGKLVINRSGPRGGRTEIHYLLSDQKHETWQLVYIVRPANIERWRPLLAELE